LCPWEQVQQHLKNLHLANNQSLNPDDRLAKLRPFISGLQEVFHGNNFLDENLRINESMILYYRRHYAKQYIRGKPIRFGFKNWALCSSMEYMYVAGNCPNSFTAQNLFDNYFTSYKLFHHLGSVRYSAIDTLWDNHCGNSPVKS